MTASRLQHTVMSSAVLAVASLVTWLSFTEEPAAAFLFPRMISVFFILFAVWNFIRAVTGLAQVGVGITPKMAMTILPGLAVALVYIYVAADTLGFYASSAMAFLAVSTLYDPAPRSDIQSWLKRITITLGFMAVMYALFAIVLKVQTPTGLFF